MSDPLRSELERLAQADIIARLERLERLMSAKPDRPEIRPRPNDKT